MRSGSKWPMIGPRPCVYACAYVDSVFTSQSYDIIIYKHKHKKNEPCPFFLCLCLCASENHALGRPLRA